MTGRYILFCNCASIFGLNKRKKFWLMLPQGLWPSTSLLAPKREVWWNIVARGVGCWDRAILGLTSGVGAWTPDFKPTSYHILIKYLFSYPMLILAVCLWGNFRDLFTEQSVHMSVEIYKNCLWKQFFRKCNKTIILKCGNCYSAFQHWWRLSFLNLCLK